MMTFIAGYFFIHPEVAFTSSPTWLQMQTFVLPRVTESFMSENFSEGKTHKCRW